MTSSTTVPRRICSLLPGASEVVAALGLADHLVGVSHECDYPPALAEKPVLVRPLLDCHGSSEAIDQAVREAAAARRPLYELDGTAFQAARPDLVITQDLCHVCAITPTELQRTLATLRPPPALLTLNPQTLTDVLRDISRIGEATGATVEASQYVATLRGRLGEVTRRRAGEHAPPRVVCLEWLEPLYVAGHWIPEMVSAAGGLDPLGHSGGSSRVIDWEQLSATQPDVIILMPCGFTMTRTLEEVHLLTRQSAWSALPAVRQDRVFVVDATHYFSRPGPRLIDGVEILASLIHPDLFGEAAPSQARRWTDERP